MNRLLLAAWMLAVALPSTLMAEEGTVAPALGEPTLLDRFAEAASTAAVKLQSIQPLHLEVDAYDEVTAMTIEVVFASSETSAGVERYLAAIESLALDCSPDGPIGDGAAPPRLVFQCGQTIEELTPTP